MPGPSSGCHRRIRKDTPSRLTLAFGGEPGPGSRGRRSRRPVPGQRPLTGNAGPCAWDAPCSSGPGVAGAILRLCWPMTYLPHGRAGIEGDRMPGWGPRVWPMGKAATVEALNGHATRRPHRPGGPDLRRAIASVRAPCLTGFARHPSNPVIWLSGSCASASSVPAILAAQAPGASPPGLGGLRLPNAEPGRASRCVRAGRAKGIFMPSGTSR